MAGDEDKKKKKKSKKEKEEKKEEAPPPEPEPEPEPQPEPAAEPEPEAQEAAPEGDASQEPTGEEAPAPEGAPAQEGMPEEAMELPPAPKKKPKFFVHWNRRKPRFYDYNWDYGDNYYSNLVKYMDDRSGFMRGSNISGYPRRMAFAERGIRSNVARRATPDVRTSNLLDDVRKSIRNFELSQKAYMK